MQKKDSCRASNICSDVGDVQQMVGQLEQSTTCIFDIMIDGFPGPQLPKSMWPICSCDPHSRDPQGNHSFC